MFLPKIAAYSEGGESENAVNYMPCGVQSIPPPLPIFVIAAKNEAERHENSAPANHSHGNRNHLQNPFQHLTSAEYISYFGAAGL